MADESDVETNQPRKKLYHKRDYSKQTHEKMMRYYADEEKQNNLLSRIKNYEEMIETLQDKISKLKQYVQPPK
jgi:wobble nucleotide-excising tRNase